MKNKTANKFRLKDKISRQTYISVDHPKFQQISREEQPQPTQFLKHGFSSEYINLAQRFKIKLIPDKNRQKRVNTTADDHADKTSKLRLRTEISRHPVRYKIDNPFHVIEAKPQSLQINERLFPSTHKNKPNHLFFNAVNRNTVYSVQFPNNRINKDLHLLNQEPGIKIKLISNLNLINLGNHCRKLLNIKNSLQNKEISFKNTVKHIKLYILREEQCSIAKLDRSFEDQPTQKHIKKLIIMQRIALLSVIANFIGGILEDRLQESSRVIEIILGFWFQIINNTYKDSIYQVQTQQTSLKQVMKLLSDAKLLTKATLPLLIQTVMQKLLILFKNFKELYQKIKFLISLSEQLSINRAFYQLLTQFAVFLTHYESKHELNIQAISFFATCPSPYLIKPATKPKSLVVDLDGTLLYTKVVNKAKNQYVTVYRPGCHQFIEELSKFYEIIIFTTSVESYARDVTKDFKSIDHFLFRQHAVRVKHGFVKDLSRIGRDLKKVIILDDLSNNFKLQKENGVKIKSWKGEADDNELQKIKEVLIKIVNSNTEDVKSQLHSYREQLQKKKVSFTDTPASPLQQNNNHKCEH